MQEGQRRGGFGYGGGLALEVARPEVARAIAIRDGEVI